LKERGGENDRPARAAKPKEEVSPAFSEHGKRAPDEEASQHIEVQLAEKGQWIEERELRWMAALLHPEE